MICPMCQKEMDKRDICLECGILYWSVKELEERKFFYKEKWGTPWPSSIEQPYYYFFKHGKFYTVPEMERLTKLKAFL
jgi:hypothetical protein